MVIQGTQWAVNIVLDYPVVGTEWVLDSGATSMWPLVEARLCHVIKALEELKSEKSER